MDRCPECQGKVEVVVAEREFEVDGYDAPCVVQNILVERCESCGKELNDKDIDAYVFKQLLIFRRKGVDVLIQEVLDEENREWKDLAQEMNLSKQNLYKQINYTNLKLNTALLCEIAWRLDRKLGDCIQYYPVVQVEGRYYLRRDVDLFSDPAPRRERK